MCSDVIGDYIILLKKEGTHALAARVIIVETRTTHEKLYKHVRKKLEVHVTVTLITIKKIIVRGSYFFLLQDNGRKFPN